MQSTVHVIEGMFDGKTVQDISFPLARPGISKGKNGYFVTVNGDGVEGYPDRNFRVHIQSPKNVLIAGLEENEEEIDERSDEEIMEDMRERFEVLEDVAVGVRENNLRAVIVSGPPGVGKSYNISKVLNDEDKHIHIHGNISALHLYMMLHDYRNEDNVIVFDDCDSIFYDDISLNILKAALDTKKKRIISWHTNSNTLNLEDIPRSFEFKGSVVFISNLKFDKLKNVKIAEHLSALQSRCHYIDLKIDTQREKLLRITQIVRDGMLDPYNFSNEVKAEIEAFVVENASRFRELSLRSVIKLADIVASVSNWKRMARMTLLK